MNGKVRNFSPTKISSITVTGWVAIFCELEHIHTDLILTMECSVVACYKELYAHRKFVKCRFSLKIHQICKTAFFFENSHLFWAGKPPELACQRSVLQMFSSVCVLLSQLPWARKTLSSSCFWLLNFVFFFFFKMSYVSDIFKV